MSLDIIPLEAFEKDFKSLFRKYPSLIRDIENLKASLLVNPQQGTSLGKNLYKIRMSIASKGQGKSGGARAVRRSGHYLRKNHKRKNLFSSHLRQIRHGNHLRKRPF
jgi:hypothetical protein